MHYVYALTSSADDYYYEQFLLSVTSLKLYNPLADAILLCDSRTKETLSGKRGEYERFVSRTITADAPASFSRVETSRWLKTSIRRLAPGDFLFIDCDTIVCDDLSAIDRPGIGFGACLDKHSPIDRHHKGANIIANDKKLGFTSYTSNRHYNSGIIYCADTPEIHGIFERWHELWLFCIAKKITRDQVSFNMAIHENQKHFTELDGTWNCQIAYNGLPYLAHAKIIHYFASDMVLNESPFLLASDKILQRIKETGLIPDTAHELLKTPRSAFAPESQICAGQDMLYVLNSSLFQFNFILRKKIPFLFNCCNGICSLLKKAAKFFIIKSAARKNKGMQVYN